MQCYNCGCDLSAHSFCTNCGVDVSRYKLIISASNIYYNDGLEKANVRDLSGAILSLRQCLKLNSSHVDARNLLGLIYFEIGEPVMAINEWVLSKNVRSQKNVADDYLNRVQSSPSKLEELNSTVKKFNQALNYCCQDSLDLAVIQLKKVLSLNPKYVQAHLLLALLYIKQEDWERALKELDRVERVDTNNIMMKRYRAEVEQVLEAREPEENPSKKNGSKKKKEKVREEAFKYQSGNETIIQPYNINDNKGAHSVWNLIIGLVIGLAVAWFLILPARVQTARQESEKDVKAVSEQLDVKNATIKELESSVKQLESEKIKLENEIEAYVGSDGTLQTVDNLLQAAALYIESPEKTKEIATYLDAIDRGTMTENTSENFTKLYDLLMRDIGSTIGDTYYENGMENYQDGDYNGAIEQLTRAITYDENNVEAYYNLANAYKKLEMKSDAIAVYQQVIDKFPGTERANRAQSQINELNQ